MAKFNKILVPVDGSENSILGLDRAIEIDKGTNAKNEKLATDFEPSIKILKRITKTIMNKSVENKTQLSLNANLNYSRLTKHIFWLEKKGLIESIIEDSKINVGLTEKGRLFTSIISN